MKKSIKFHLLFSFVLAWNILFFTTVIKAQLPCSISIDRPQPVCYNAEFGLSVQNQSGLTYLWSPGGETTASIRVKIKVPTDFSVTITDPQTGNTCTSTPFHVTVYAGINLNFKQLQLTCTDGDQDNGNTAQVKATASGVFPSNEYQYFWNVKPIQISPDNHSIAVGLKALQNYSIRVEDPNGCAVEDTFYTRAYSNPLVKVFANPDTAYIQNPHIKFSFQNLSSDSIQISNNFWEFGKDPNSYSAKEVNYTFTETGTYPAYLTVYNQQGCDTVYTKLVQIFPVKLFIPNVFTPNGDGINDTFVITEAGASQTGASGLKDAAASADYKPLNTYYESSNLVIFNRMGRKVFESTDYHNDWNGGNLPDETYFYVLKCRGFKDKKVVYKGSVSIFAGHK